MWLGSDSAPVLNAETGLRSPLYLSRVAWTVRVEFSLFLFDSSHFSFFLLPFLPSLRLRLFVQSKQEFSEQKRTRCGGGDCINVGRSWPPTWFSQRCPVAPYFQNSLRDVSLVDGHPSKPNEEKTRFPVVYIFIPLRLALCHMYIPSAQQRNGMFCFILSVLSRSILFILFYFLGFLVLFLCLPCPLMSGPTRDFN